MISGFNTDIKVGRKVYHVQTEDKGAKTRLILSLVYDKGTILASKRSIYDENVGAEELTEKVNRQHKLICAAVSAGRIDDLVRMASGSRARSAQPVAEAVAVPIGIPMAPSEDGTVSPLPVSMPTMPVDAPVETLEPIFDDVTIIDDDLILGPEAVAVISELSGKERSSNQKLGVEILGDQKFKSGERRTVNLMVCRGTERKVIAGAEIMIKVIGSTFRPVIFHARTDANGLANVHLQVPQFDAGRAALLVRAIAGGEEIELRKMVTPR